MQETSIGCVDQMIFLFDIPQSFEKLLIGIIMKFKYWGSKQRDMLE